MRPIIAALLIAVAGTVHAQPAPVAPAPAVPAALPAEPDPARLSAATRLVEVVMPPALRKQMTEQTVDAMTTNVGNAIMASPQMVAAFEKQPRARPIFERYMAKQAESTRTMMQDVMPDIMTVMARYYARQMNVAQIEAVHDFYATPTGQQFALASAGVMADPEYGRLMQSTMKQVMARAPAQVEAMMDELKALQPVATSK